jgi:transcriptional regulator with XRE-family HTH domain
MDRHALFIEKKKKKLTDRVLSEALNCSPSLLSKYFNNECNISPEKERKLVQLIQQAKEFRWVRVPVE